VIACANQLHFEAGKLKFLGSTCPNCTVTAKAKLVCYRACFAVAGVPVGVLAGTVYGVAMAPKFLGEQSIFVFSTSFSLLPNASNSHFSFPSKVVKFIVQ
jgi:hypothetical protein